MTTPASFVPSYFLWDANAALHDYLKHGALFQTSDLPPAARDALGLHTVILEVPLARRLTYGYGWNPDYGAPPGEHYTLLESNQVQAPSSNQGPSSGTLPLDDYTGEIADALTKAGANGGAPVDPADVPLALFCGLVHQTTTSETDTTSGAWEEAGPLMLKELEDALSQNYVKMEADVSKWSDVYAGEGAAAHDQSYYQVTVTNRAFSAPTTGTNLQTALSALKAAHAAGTSIADALDALADQGIRPALFRQLAGVHRANEEQAIRAVNDPGFAPAQAAPGQAPPSGVDLANLRSAVLLGAGAPVDAAPTFTLIPHLSVLAALSPRLPALSRAALAGARPASVLSATGTARSTSLTTGGKVVVGGLALGAAYLAWRKWFA